MPSSLFNNNWWRRKLFCKTESKQYLKCDYCEHIFSTKLVLTIHIGLKLTELKKPEVLLSGVSNKSLNVSYQPIGLNKVFYTTLEIFTIQCSSNYMARITLPFIKLVSDSVCFTLQCSSMICFSIISRSVAAKSVFIVEEKMRRGE